MTDAPSSTDKYSTMVAVLSMCLCLLYSGIIFGWAPMQLLLEHDGAYRDLCPASDPLCEERTNRLILLYTVGSTAAVLGGFPCGVLVDLIGPLRCSILSGICCTNGLLMFALPSAGGLDLLLPGSALVGFGGTFILLASMPASFVLQASSRTLYLSAVTCLFDASSVTFLLAFQLYSHVGMSRHSLFVGMASLCAALHIALATAWSRGPSAKLQAVKAEEVASRDFHPAMAESAVGAQSAAASAVEAGDAVKLADVEVIKSRRALHGLPLIRQLKTFEFCFVLVTYGFHNFRTSLYLGTNKEFLRDLGDENTGYAYAQIFAASLPMSTVFLPLIKRCLERRGFADTFLLIAALGATYNGFALVRNLPFQMFAFAAFSCFRAFLYSAHFVFLLHTFGSRTTGGIQGVLVLFSAPANFCIWPCTVIANSFDRGFLYLYSFALLLCMAPGVMALLLKVRLRGAPTTECSTDDE